MTRLFTTALSLFCLSVCLYSNSASATEYQIYFDNGYNCASGGGVNTVVGSVDTFFTSYNSATRIFTWSFTIKECTPGVLADGYWLAVNNGPNPKGHAGEMAIYYFDASDMSNPKLTAYAYNGENGNVSYKDGDKNLPGNQTADRIRSSVAGDQSWLLDLGVVNEPDGVSRTFYFTIDAGAIQDHSPLRPDPVDPWIGTQYAEFMGAWFHPTYGTVTAYCSENDSDPICQDVAPGQSSIGYLKNFEYRAQGWYDVAYVPTNEVPTCVTRIGGNTYSTRPVKTDAHVTLARTDLVSRYEAALRRAAGEKPYCQKVEIGQTFDANFTGSDPDAQQLYVFYSGEPSGSSITDSNNQPLVNGGAYPVPVTAYMEWTPTLADGGSEHHVEFVMAEDRHSSAKCALDLCVPENNAPQCDLQITTEEPNLCQGYETELEFNACNSTDPDQDPLFYEFFTDCEDSTLEQIDYCRAKLTLTRPGTGVSQQCSVHVVVNDGFEEHKSKCTVPVDVDGCDLDCLGEPNGNAQLDACGVCDGDNSTCSDCNGVPNGNAELDQCGVCDGTNSCLDCAGTPNGTAVIDDCGICGGDSSSCLGCTESDYTSVQFEMDGGLHSLESTIEELTRKPRNGDIPYYVKRAKKYVKQGKALRDSGWTITWSIPSIQNVCTNSILCVSVSNTDTIDTYTGISKKMLKLAKKSRKLLLQYLEASGHPSKKAGRKFQKQAKKQHQENLTQAEVIPESFSTCN